MARISPQPFPWPNPGSIGSCRSEEEVLAAGVLVLASSKSRAGLARNSGMLARLGASAKPPQRSTSAAGDRRTRS